MYLAEMAKVHISFTQVEVQILVFKNTLVKVEVLTKLLYAEQRQRFHWSLFFREDQEMMDTRIVFKSIGTQ